MLTSFSANSAMPGQSTLEPHLWHNTAFTFLPSSDTREGSNVTDPSGEDVGLLPSILISNFVQTENKAYNQLELNKYYLIKFGLSIHLIWK